MNQQQEVFKKYEQKIAEYNEHLEGLKSTKNDYKELINTLTHLPDTLQPKIMVPLGKLAFFEGNLKSTNEILILLGDNYFAKRSSKQTIDIIQRRDKDIDNNIKDLREQIKGLKQRVSLTTDISKAMHEKEYDNIIEIKEEYNSDEEREKEKKRNQPKKTTTTTTTTTNTPKTTTAAAPIKDKVLSEAEKKKKEEMDQEFDKMLKRLSILEEKESKMGDDYDEDDFNQKFNKKLNIKGSKGHYDENDDENDDEDGFNNYGNVNNDDEEEEYNEFEYEEGEEEQQQNVSNKTPEIHSYTPGDDEYDDDNEQYYDEDDETVEYYDEFGNVVDINDPNVEYIQDSDDEDEQQKDETIDKDVIEDFNENELEVIKKDFHLDKKGTDLSETEVKELTDFYHSKQKKRISYIDTPQPPTQPSETTNTTKPKSILKTNSSNNLNEPSPIQPYNENDENDVRRYIKNLGKQDLFENHKTISVPNPPKDMAFSGDIIEKQTDLFPFDEIPKVPTQSNAKQSRFKSSRQNK